jgi:phage terminase small subunit
MPARKPSALNKRHDLSEDKAARAAAEGAMTPQTQLRRVPPPVLKNHKTASETWSRIVALYFEIEGSIVTAFDEDTLVKYCLAEEEMLKLQKMCDGIERERVRLQNKLDGIKGLSSKNLDVYYGLLEQFNALSARFQGMDARLDGKRKLIHALAQSLYLTPRSRAGVAPSEKEPDKPKSETERALE